MITNSIDFKSYASTHKFTTLQCKCCGELLVVPVYCGNRFCPLCSKPRMMRIKLRLKSLMDSIHLKKSEHFAHMVLTIRSQPDVKEMCHFLVQSFKKFRGRKIFKKNAVGGAYVLELTHNDSGWHAHLHVILQARYVPQAELLSSWRSIVHHGGVFIKKIPKSAIINYLSKYMCKIELADELRDIAGEHLKKTRLFTVFGLWHNLLPGWSKVPYHCTQCDSVQWTIARNISFEDHVNIDEIIKQKYG